MLFFGGAIFAAGFFAAVFLADVIFPALELRRALPEELAFFIVNRTLHIGIEDVKPIVETFHLSSFALVVMVHRESRTAPWSAAGSESATPPLEWIEGRYARTGLCGLPSQGGVGARSSLCHRTPRPSTPSRREFPGMASTTDARLNNRQRVDGTECLCSHGYPHTGSGSAQFDWFDELGFILEIIYKRMLIRPTVG